MIKYIVTLLTVIGFISGEEPTRIYHKDGGSVEGKILEANQTHVLFQRAEDLQQFRFKIDQLALNSQQTVDLYHREQRYSNIPKVDTPLDAQTLKKYTNYIDELILRELRSKKIPANKLYKPRIYWY